MNESARRAALVIGLSTVASGAARGAEPDEPIVTFESPKGCPDRDAFVTQVRARTRTGTLLPKEPRAVMRLDVRVTKQGGSSSASVTVTDADGRKGTRRITAPSCREAVDGIALVTALTLDPTSPEAAPGEPAPGETPGAGASGGTAASSSPRSASTAATATNAAAAALEGEPAAPPPVATGTAEAPAPEPPRVDVSGPDRASEPPDNAARDGARAGALHVAAGVSVLGLTAPVPSVAPALEVSGEVRVELNELLDLGFRGGLRLSNGSTLSTDEGNAAFEWWAVAVGVCPGARTPTDALSLALCAMFEQGQTHAEGSETENPQSSRSSWTALGPALRGRWAFVPRAALEVGFDTLFPFRKDAFSLGGEQVHEVAPVALRFGAGVAFRFR